MNSSEHCLPDDTPTAFGDRQALSDHQRQRLQALLKEILPRNAFYARKFVGAAATDPLAALPFTTKAELLADQAEHPPYGQVLTYPGSRYCRLHQTSGTSGKPLRWLDTPESWNWLLGCWKQMFRLAGVHAGDRLFFPFSFGPFLGFWTAFDAATRLGYLAMPAGGMSSVARLRFLLENEGTVIFCTPTYALRLAEAAQEEGIQLTGSSVRALIVAGEPGGSIPATRQRIETAWGARIFDHCGMTELGAAGIECQANPAGLHIVESEYIAEVLDVNTHQPVPPGQPGELVMTNLGRWGSPLIRYRTGDIVRVDPRPCLCGSSFLRLEGGILGRTDDMIHLRGNNLYPSALEAIIRRFPEVAEYRVEVDQAGTLADLRIELEAQANVAEQSLAERVARAIRDELLFRADVRTVPRGALPRYEMKARRVQVKNGRQEIERG
jgi:phenylacetate-CoA ligase